MRDFKRIGDFAKVRRGASPRPIDDPKWFGGDIGWVRIVDVTRSKRYLRSTEQYLSPLGEARSVRVDKGDLIMSICATIGRPVIVDMAACIHDGFVQFYDIRDADTEYLYYALQHAEQEFLGHGQHGTQANLNTTIVGRHNLFVPPLPQQRKIARILTTVDNLIEKTEALITDYQAIKQGMMHDLFTRGVDEHGHPRPPYEEAPELYKQSELGWIPKEWEAGPLGTFFTLQRGFDITQEQQREGPFPVVSSSGITSYHAVAMCRGPGVVIGRKGKLGDAYYLEGPYWPHDTSLWVKDFHGNHPRFVSLFLAWLRLERFDAATSVPTLNRNFIHPLIVAIPKSCEQERIASLVAALSRRIGVEIATLRKCQVLKTGLMQDLLTGNLRVKADETEEVAAYA